MLRKLDKADAAAPGLAVFIRPRRVEEQLRVQNPRVGLRGALLDGVEEDALELLLVHLKRHVAHLQARLADEKVWVLQLHRLFLPGAAAFLYVRLRHAARRGTLLVHLALAREVQVAVVPRAVALRAAAHQARLRPLLRQRRRLGRAHRQRDRQATPGDLHAAALLLLRRRHRRRRGAGLVEVHERRALRPAGGFVHHQAARAHGAERAHALVHLLLRHLRGHVAQEHGSARLGRRRPLRLRAGKGGRLFVVRGRLFFVADDVFRDALRALQLRRVSSLLQFAFLLQSRLAMRLASLTTRRAATRVCVARLRGVLGGVRVLHHAEHHATKHGIVILDRFRFRVRVSVRAVDVLDVVSDPLVVVVVVGRRRRSIVVVGRSVVVVVVVVRPTRRLLPVRSTRCLLRALLFLRVLVLVALLGRLRLRLGLRLGVGVLGERPVHRHRPPRDGGAVHLVHGPLGVRLGGVRREREPLGLAVEIARHGQVPHEPRLGQRRPDILVRSLEREVADDHAPALRLGALAPAELPRPQHGRQSVHASRAHASRVFR